MKRAAWGWRRWLVVLAALAAMATTLVLGRWQLHRADEKTALHAATVARGRLPAVDGAALATKLTPEQQGELVHRRISLTGEWLPEHTIYLDNRVMDQRTGFYVLTPLRLAGSGTVVLVQRGWAPRNFQDRLALPPVVTPAGVVHLEGRVAAQPSRAYALGVEGHAAIRQNLDLDAFRAESGLALASLIVWQTGEPSEGLVRQWPEPTSDVDKHLGYAFQWFALCALIAVLLVWFQVVRPLRRSSHA